MKKINLLLCGLALLIILGAAESVFCATNNWTATQRTTSDYNKFTTRSVLDTANNKIYYAWHESDGSRYQIWTGEMNTDGSGWSATKQTTTDFHKFNPELVGSHHWNGN